MEPPPLNCYTMPNLVECKPCQRAGKRVIGHKPGEKCPTNNTGPHDQVNNSVLRKQLATQHETNTTRTLNELGLPTPTYPLQLYHGTTTQRLNEASAGEGLIKPFVTTDPELAEYYAETEAEETGGTPQIVTFTVNNNLKYDSHAIDEPVAGNNSTTTLDELEETRNEMWDTIEETAPEWCKNGYADIPEEAWEISIATVNSAQSTVNITEWETH